MLFVFMPGIMPKTILFDQRQIGNSTESNQVWHGFGASKSLDQVRFERLLQRIR